MDISKKDLGDKPHSSLNMDIAGNFSEQISDSSSNHGDLGRIQNNNRAINSPCEEETTIKNSKADGCSKEGDVDTIGNSNGLSSALASPTSKKTLPKQSDALSKTKTKFCSSSSIRDEKDIKKDDASLSPQIISPMGLASGVGQQSSRDNDDNNGMSRNSNLSPLSSDKGAIFSRSGCNEMEERSKANIATISNAGNGTSNIETGCSGNLGASVSPKCNAGSDFVCNTSNISRNLTSFNGNLSKYNSSTSAGDGGRPMNSSGGNSGSDYMQQQNHVFVFSTHLANKSAEAVLCGQFPTIIAYHCMQPTTKLFLEDFLKNPTKTTKLQRQYSLNIMNVIQSGSSGPAGGQSPYWLNECTNIDRLHSQRIALRNVGVSSVGKNNSSWDSTSVVENQLCNAPSPSHTLNGADAGGKGDDISNIPSLQGVKVPDENLTPQQRQHREEQLAKLKKMNKFLFPENEGTDFQGPTPHSSSSSISDSVGNSGDMVHNSAGLSSNGMVKQNCPPTLRNTSENSAKSVPKNHDTISSTGVSETIMPPDIIRSSNDAPSVDRVQNLKFGCYMPKMNSPTVNNINALKSRQCDMGNKQSVIGVENIPGVSSGGNFITNNCPSSKAESVGSCSSNMAMSQSEWTKFQSSTFQDGFKAERQQNVVNQSGLSPETFGCQQNSELSCSLSTEITGYGSAQSGPNTSTCSTNRNNNGPPPPYHQAQRASSVPISAESPTNASPNRPSADMSLPSSQASSRVEFGVSATTPNSEISNQTNSTCTTYIGPTSDNVNNSSQVNSHCNSILNSIVTNSPASLQHISPRELDCIEPGVQKSKMISPHKFKSASGMINDLPDMETKYSNFGMGYSTCNMPPQVMRHNVQQMPPQFCRRIDNIPLNPNCSRLGQSKNVTNFDPISSLTQMSQQLTGVGLSAIGSGGNASGGLGVMDINQGDIIAGGSSMRGSGDPSLDHCNQVSNSNNMGMIGGLAGALGRVTGQFAPEMNNMLGGDTGPMEQRMLNGKLCATNMPGSNSALTGVGLRESALGCNDMSSSNRMMNRRGMPGNFENFSMPPNIHVKVSAPNTIQYMPARSQNMRVPPSVEFFQRYSNSQVMANVGGAVGHPSGGPMTNDIANLNGMNMFGNCTQMPAGVGQLTGRGFEQTDLVEGHLLSNNNFMNVPQ